MNRLNNIFTLRNILITIGATLGTALLLIFLGVALYFIVALWILSGVGGNISNVEKYNGDLEEIINSKQDTFNLPGSMRNAIETNPNQSIDYSTRNRYYQYATNGEFINIGDHFVDRPVIIEYIYGRNRLTIYDYYTSQIIVQVSQYIYSDRGERQPPTELKVVNNVDIPGVIINDIDNDGFVDILIRGNFLEDIFQLDRVVFGGNDVIGDRLDQINFSDNQYLHGQNMFFESEFIRPGESANNRVNYDKYIFRDGNSIFMGSVNYYDSSSGSDIFISHEFGEGIERLDAQRSQTRNTVFNSDVYYDSGEKLIGFRCYDSQDQEFVNTDLEGMVIPNGNIDAAIAYDPMNTGAYFTAILDNNISLIKYNHGCNLDSDNTIGTYEYITHLDNFLSVEDDFALDFVANGILLIRKYGDSTNKEDRIYDLNLGGIRELSTFNLSQEKSDFFDSKNSKRYFLPGYFDYVPNTITKIDNQQLLDNQKLLDNSSNSLYKVINEYYGIEIVSNILLTPYCKPIDPDSVEGIDYEICKQDVSFENSDQRYDSMYLLSKEVGFIGLSIRFQEILEDASSPSMANEELTNDYIYRSNIPKPESDQILINSELGEISRYVVDEDLYVIIEDTPTGKSLLLRVVNYTSYTRDQSRRSLLDSIFDNINPLSVN